MQIEKMWGEEFLHKKTAPLMNCLNVAIITSDSLRK